MEIGRAINGGGRKQSNIRLKTSLHSKDRAVSHHTLLSHGQETNGYACITENRGEYTSNGNDRRKRNESDFDSVESAWLPLSQRDICQAKNAKNLCQNL